MDKIELRKGLITKRLSIPADQQEIAANKAAKLFIQHLLTQDYQHIGCYLSQNGELSCAPIIQAIWQTKKKCYLPVLSTTDAKHLDFGLYEKNTPLYLNRFQILEPQTSEKVAATHLNLVLMPLVGFDLKGHRLGMGGGYYDKTFEFCLKNPQSLFLVGVGYEEQQMEEWLPEAWDVPLGGILTENRFILTQR
jgi:5-formyltetrahydrofolate cyclo-ligase